MTTTPRLCHCDICDEQPREEEAEMPYCVTRGGYHDGGTAGCGFVTTGTTTPGRQPFKCPVCNGQGLVSVPPGVAGDLATFPSSSCGPWQCRVCAGTGLAWG